MEAPNDSVFVLAGIDFKHTKSNEHSQETVFLLPLLVFNEKSHFTLYWMVTSIHVRLMGYIQTGTVFPPKNCILMFPCLTIKCSA